ncbi:hypothetical protein BP6252_00026 [Coleophoma cylindrospora]|uniref:Transcription factor domain-containing protein n=1 Tax=Coleophoma cylindrospora TaxID=1849047 RepID=A0A3D8SP82_9HELO|nr:hypothetical protein BP6252_00026 [Coleophoma cylindrospora]
MLFAHVQGAVSPSPNLIQAGILITLYEYAHSKLDTAYTSIKNCAKMAHTLGLHELMYLEDNEERLEGKEQKNIWWTIVIYERVIFCDIMPIDQHLATAFPSSVAPLPLESAVLDKTDDIHSRASTRRLGSAIDIEHLSNFVGQAQAANLLDQVLSVIRTVDRKTKLLELPKIDERLMGLLGVLLEKSYSTREHYCGAIAICIRALHVLHGYVSDPAFTQVEIWGQNSAAALNTLCEMVIDIAKYYNKQFNLLDDNLPPPAIFYIAQASLKHLHKDQSFETGVEIEDYKVLRKYLDNLNSKWNVQ